MIEIPQDVKDFFTEIGMCEDGYQTMINLGNYGLTFDQAADRLEANGYPKYAQWVREQKKTEAYVRFYGKVITVIGYQVFNPLTGQHTRYETEEEAKAALCIIAQDILDNNTPRVNQEIANEHGDTAWIPYTVDKFKVTL